MKKLYRSVIALILLLGVMTAQANTDIENSDIKNSDMVEKIEASYLNKE